MIDEAGFFGAYIRSTPERRKEFWKFLEERMKEQGIAAGFYHPYIPLQTTNTETQTAIKIKTRYDKD